MRETQIGGVRRTIAAHAMTDYLYEQTFGSSHKLHEDINEILGARYSAFTMMPMGALLRVEYILERGAAPRTKPFVTYDYWLDSLPIEALDQNAAQDAGGWANNLIDEVVATFFPRLARAQLGANAAEEPEGPEDAPEGAAGETVDAPDVEGA